jgi:hypothetical protein
MRIVEGMPTTSTTLPTSEAIGRLRVELQMVGATIVDQTADSIRGTITVKNRPSILLTLIIATLSFWLLCIPAVIYLIAATKTVVVPFEVAVGGDRITYVAKGKAFSPVERAVYAAR